MNFRCGDLDEVTMRYNPSKLVDGFNMVGSEEVFFVSNPALDLWAHGQV